MSGYPSQSFATAILSPGLLRGEATLWDGDTSRPGVVSRNFSAASVAAFSFDRLRSSLPSTAPAIDPIKSIPMSSLLHGHQPGAGNVGNTRNVVGEIRNVRS